MVDRPSPGNMLLQDRHDNWMKNGRTDLVTEQNGGNRIGEKKRETERDWEQEMSTKKWDMRWRQLYGTRDSLRLFSHRKPQWQEIWTGVLFWLKTRGSPVKTLLNKHHLRTQHPWPTEKKPPLLPSNASSQLLHSCKCFPFNPPLRCLWWCPQHLRQLGLLLLLPTPKVAQATSAPVRMQSQCCQISEPLSWRQCLPTNDKEPIQRPTKYLGNTSLDPFPSLLLHSSCIFTFRWFLF